MNHRLYLPQHNNTPGANVNRVRIAVNYHPLYGQILRVLRVVRRKDGVHFHVELPDGKTQTIPERWARVIDEDEEIGYPDSDSQLSPSEILEVALAQQMSTGIEDVRAILRLAEELRSRIRDANADDEEAL
jgi:hypothetical protein